MSIKSLFIRETSLQIRSGSVEEIGNENMATEDGGSASAPAGTQENGTDCAQTELDNASPSLKHVDSPASPESPSPLDQKAIQRLEAVLEPAENAYERVNRTLFHYLLSVGASPRADEDAATQIVQFCNKMVRQRDRYIQEYQRACASLLELKPEHIALVNKCTALEKKHETLLAENENTNLRIEKMASTLHEELVIANKAQYERADATTKDLAALKESIDSLTSDVEMLKEAGKKLREDLYESFDERQSIRTIELQLEERERKLRVRNAARQHAEVAQQLKRDKKQWDASQRRLLQSQEAALHHFRHQEKLRQEELWGREVLFLQEQMETMQKSHKLVVKKLQEKHEAATRAWALENEKAQCKNERMLDEIIDAHDADLVKLEKKYHTEIDEIIDMHDADMNKLKAIVREFMKRSTNSRPPSV